MSRYQVHRSDATHEDIVSTLRAYGAEVHIIGRPVDLLIAWRRQTFLAEVKTPKGRFKKSQADFFRKWVGAPAVVLTSVADVVQLLDGGDIQSLIPTEDDLKRIRS